MTAHETDQLAQKKCLPCEGGVPRLDQTQAGKLADQLSGWSIIRDGSRIRKEWVVRHFRDALIFFQRVGEIAEKEGHHPDLHLEGFRNVAIEIWTHAIGGLSENDFILAAKIDQLPIDLKKSAPAKH